MSGLTKAIVLTGFTIDQLPRLQDILEQHRAKLEEGNAFAYFERVSVTTPSTINTEFTVTCSGLNRTPTYYMVIKKDKAVDVYTGSTAWAKNKLYLKATVASAAITILVTG